MTFIFIVLQNTEEVIDQDKFKKNDRYIRETSTERWQKLLHGSKILSVDILSFGTGKKQWVT